MKQCPNGHEVGGEAKFCPICGAEVIDNGTTYCAKCGSERKGTEKFCSQCGTPFGVSPMLGNNKTPQKSSKKGIVIAAVVCLLMLATGGAAWYFLQKDKYSLEGLALAAVNYDKIGIFRDGMAMVWKGETFGYIDRKGNEIIPCIYKGENGNPYYLPSNFSEGLALVEQGDRMFFINKEGKEAFPFNYEGAHPFHDGLALVWRNGKYGYIDKKGNEVITLNDKYYGDDFSEGFAAAWEDQEHHEKYGYIDKKGNIVISMQYEAEYEAHSFPFSQGLAVVQKDGKYGYIDTNGNEVIPCKYEYALTFSEGLAPVHGDNGWGYVDKMGNEVIPCNFATANSFSGGYAAVSKDDEHYFFIDKSGNEVLSCNYDCLFSTFQDGITSIINNEHKVGYIDIKGNEVIPCIYDDCFYSEGIATVQKDGVWGFVDQKGNSTFDIQNEDVKRVVQAKIKQKEEERRKEEQRMEEERRRIEEENKPYNLFYKIAQGGDYVWESRYFGLDFSYGEKTILYFYPSNKGGGRVTLLSVPKDESKKGYYAGFSGTGFYTVTADFLSFSIEVLPGGWVGTKWKEINIDFNFEIKKDGNYITLIRLLDNRYKVNKAEYYQRRKERQDPLN